MDVPAEKSPNSEHVPAVTLRGLARLFGVSPATVSGWCGAGMPHTHKGARTAAVTIQLEQALPWVLANAGAPPPGSQRERLAKVQADKVEMENARRGGELVLVSVVSEILNAVASDMSGRLDALPGRVANELAGISQPAEVRARLLRETRAIRAGLAECFAKLAEHAGRAADGGDDCAPAERQDPEPVGRRKPRVAARKRRARSVPVG